MRRALQSFAFSVLLCAVSGFAFSNPPPKPLSSFEKAKRVARDTIYSDHRIDFYCSCEYTPNKTGTSGKIDASSCGYEPRKDAKRGRILEWEHVVPAAFFGQHKMCWKKGHATCVKKDGKAYKGRDCCGKVDKVFKRIEADLHNLAPAVGELNGDRSNTPFGIVEGEHRLYGECDFEIGGKPKVTEPRDEVKGDAARAWLYMIDTYKITISASQLAIFKEWSKEDPVDAWERLRDKRIEAAQGNSNPYVR